MSNVYVLECDAAHGPASTTDMADDDVANADVADANAYEILVTSPVISSVTNSEQLQLVELTEATRLPEDPPMHTETANSVLTSQLTIDCFPHGLAGAPIPGVCQGPTSYESAHGTLGDSKWAPFRSQCDWEIARWAKMQGPTSSAVTELLAISEVCYLQILFILWLMHSGRSLRSSVSLTRP
jgi:hypothetical protein